MKSDSTQTNKQQSRFSRPSINQSFSGKAVNGDQKNSLAAASGRFLMSVRNRKAAPKGK